MTDLTARLREGHKYLGLAMAALLYLLSLTGTMSVFYLALERWESPANAEMSYASPNAVGTAFDDLLARAAKDGEPREHLGMSVPNPSFPRLIGGLGEAHFAYNGEGRMTGTADHPITHFVTKLHYTLHLPQTAGLIIVAIAGIAMLALALGGVFSLPRIARDAFRLRRGGSKQLVAADQHNRIGVWTLPLSLAVVLSGCVMGLASVALWMGAVKDFGGDTVQASDAMFSRASPVSEPHAKPGAPVITGFDVKRALAWLEARGERTLYFSVADRGRTSEHLQIGVARDNRLIYSDTYVFDREGRLRGTQGMNDGPAGQQFYGSMFRLHAGAFGGPLVAWLYVALGMGLTMLCTSGMTIWFEKRRARGHDDLVLERLWQAVVWGTPVSIALWCMAAFGVEGLADWLFWPMLTLIALSVAWLRVPVAVLGLWFRLATGAAFLGVASAHIARFGADAWSPIGLMVNAALLALGLGIALPAGLALRRLARDSRSEAPKRTTRLDAGVPIA